MITEDHLKLRLVCLKSVDDWSQTRAELSFLFPKAGAANYINGTGAQRLGPGDVLVLGEDARGKLSVSNGGDLTFWCFSLRLEHMMPLFAATEISLLQDVAQSLRGAKLFPASAPLAIQCHRLIAETSPQPNLDHRSQLLRVAACILAEQLRVAHRHRAGFVRIEEHMVQIFEKLSADELLSLSVGELADRFGCSRRHLNRLFHQYFNYSVAAFRMEMRLLKAVCLLRDPDAKVINVAEQCGFNHLGLFNTCFKRRFGASPGQWRKMASQPGEQTGRSMEADSACALRSNGLCPWAGKLQDCTSPATKESTFQNAGRASGLAALRDTNRASRKQAAAPERGGREACKPGALQLQS